MVHSTERIRISVHRLYWRSRTPKNTHTCIGVAFEVGKADTDIRKYCFFSHSGKIPEDEYLTEEGVPYTIAKLKNW